MMTRQVTQGQATQGYLTQGQGQVTQVDVTP